MSEETDQFDLPEPLAGALRAAYTHRVEIPASVDQAILSATHAKFAQRRRLRLVASWGTGLAAGIAAMIVVVLSLHRPASNAVIAKGDINGDGNLNIVDALTLARHIAAHDTLDKAWDINGDGVIDQRDVDALASAAVSLKQTSVAKNSLPKLHELGIDHTPRVGFASANGISPTACGVPCPPEPRINVILDEGLFGSGGHVLAAANMPTPADNRASRNTRRSAGEGMAPGDSAGTSATITFAKANPTKNTKEETR